MSYIPDMTVLRGLSIDAASKFGMPHVGSHYLGKAVRSNRLDEGARCAVCGAPATNSHHVPSVGMGGRNASFKLHGRILRPALIALCGSGTTGCHGMAHAGIYRFSWEWDEDSYERRWWDGDLFACGIEPHDQKLYTMGRWVVTNTATGRETEIREGI